MFFKKWLFHRAAKKGDIKKVKSLFLSIILIFFRFFKKDRGELLIQVCKFFKKMKINKENLIHLLEYRYSFSKRSSYKNN